MDFGKYIGIPFSDHGRDMNGCDCWGLVCLIYKELYDFGLPDLGPLYKSTLDKNGMLSLHASQLSEWEKTETPRVGDVVNLRIQGIPIHVGIVISENQMIHIQRGIDSVIERFDDGLWAKRVEGFYRFNPKLLGGNSLRTETPNSFEA